MRSASFCFWIVVVLLLTAVMVYAQAGAPAASPFPKVTIRGSRAIPGHHLFQDGATPPLG
jgi:hypothetical protein